jgi:hypothetical protein
VAARQIYTEPGYERRTSTPASNLGGAIGTAVLNTYRVLDEAPARIVPFGRLARNTGLHSAAGHVVGDLLAECLSGVLIAAEVLPCVDATGGGLVNRLGEAVERPHDARHVRVGEREVQPVGAGEVT